MQCAQGKRYSYCASVFSKSRPSRDPGTKHQNFFRQFLCEQYCASRAGRFGGFMADLTLTSYNYSLVFRGARFGFRGVSLVVPVALAGFDTRARARGRAPRGCE